MDSDLESPRKRPKLEAPQSSLPAQNGTDNDIAMTSTTGAITMSSMIDDEASKEAQVGITRFLSSDSTGFSGLLKKRYTDFLVNEVLPDGRVLHLESLKAPKAVKEAEEPKPVEIPPKPAADEIHGEASKGEAKGNANGGEPDGEKADTSSLPAEISQKDRDTLVTHFDEETASKAISLYAKVLAVPDRKAAYYGSVQSTTPITDRGLRTKIHQDVRRIFKSKIESSTSSEGSMILSAASNASRKPGYPQQSNQMGRPNRQGKLGWGDLGGEYLHFTIYKENKDTMEVISFLARELKMAPKGFNFAGTKDRRAVTAQRASVYRVYADRLAALNRSLRYSNVGDFRYERRGLQLGELSGNEFVITLRDCEFGGLQKDSSIEQRLTSAKESVTKAMRKLHDKGFFNYYGLQRFGTFASRTDAVGVKLLQGDFKGACDIILDFNPTTLTAAQDNESTAKISSEDKLRAEALHLFQTTGKVGPALDKLPRKFSAESNLIRHLGRQSNDFPGAIMMIPRNLRIMYAHAYQSLVWNFAVGERWRLYGEKVAEGDLVLVNEHKDKNTPTTEGNANTTTRANDNAETDADGELIVRPSIEDSAPSLDEVFERARPLTSTEASSGAYTIFDIVLPLPGFDILYPSNEVGSFYKSFMATESLDPSDMRRKQKDFSLSGGYRKMLARIGEGWEVNVKSYAAGGEETQFVETDLDRLKRTSNNKDAGNARNATTTSVDSSEPVTQADSENTPAATKDQPSAKDEKIAVIIKMSLGSSQYATMALRELAKGGVRAYKPDFGAGR